MTNKTKFTIYQCLILLILQVLVNQTLISSPVDTAKANYMASQFYQNYVLKDKNTQANIQHVSTIQQDGFKLLYIFNFEHGFVIVSANDMFEPIIGYSDEQVFPTEKMPEVLNFWISQYTKPMLQIIKESKSSFKHPKWDILFNQFVQKSIPIITGVQPLLTSRWNQAELYNDSCPAISSGPNGRCYAGCVATSMGQIMYYHKYPANGNGVHSYNHPHFGDITVNYGNTTYDWNAMGNVSTGNTRSEISKLIYHCGVSVDMNYGPTGSGSNSELALGSFIEHFGYRTDARYVERSAYGLFEWRRLIIDNLYTNMPVLYSGNDASAGGHAWVCDGVNDSLYFHMNWGWSGAGNGYFLLDSLNSGNGNFSSYQSAVINIAPIYQEYCIHDKEYFENEVTFNDGSNQSLYKNNSDCRYTIATDSFQVRMNFIYFDTEENNDILNIYDGEDVNAPLIGSYSGNSLPPVLYSTGNKVYLQFITNELVQKQGWEMRYVRYKPTEISEFSNNYDNSIIISPNPSHDKIFFNLPSVDAKNLDYSVYDVSGRIIDKGIINPNGDNVFEFNIGHLKNGVYFLKIDTKNISQLGKIIKI